MQDLAHLRQRIDDALREAVVQLADLPDALRSGLSHALRQGGRRLRPLLVYSLGEALEIPLIRLDAAAVAIECLHAYSLVHDDLPAMDNDFFRRGAPSVHALFGEAQAILIGDALHSLAFETLACDRYASDSLKLRLIRTLTWAAGPSGMITGQWEDIEALRHQKPPISWLLTHKKKTGMLIAASMLMAVHISQDPRWLEPIQKLGLELGVAYQVRDDLMDGDMALFWNRSEAEAFVQHAVSNFLALFQGKPRAGALHLLIQNYFSTESSELIR